MDETFKDLLVVSSGSCDINKAAAVTNNQRFYHPRPTLNMQMKRLPSDNQSVGGRAPHNSTLAD